MKVITTTEARKNIAAIVDRVRDTGEVFGIGRRNGVDVLLVAFPASWKKTSNDITNVNAYSRSFDFLADEPDLYSAADAKRRHA